MHAVLVQVTIKDEPTARQILSDEIVPTVSQAPGFVAGYWVRLGDDQGRSVIIFESEDAARTASEMVRSGAGDNDAVELNDVSLGEVVANA